LGPDFVDPGNLRRSAGAFAILLGLGGVIGWQLGVAVLRSLIAGRATMHPATGVALVLLGVSLCLVRPSAPSHAQGYLASIAAILAGLVGFLKLAQHLTGWDAGIDGLLRSMHLSSAPVGQLGQMAGPTALALLLTGAGLPLVGRSGRAVNFVAHLIAITVGLIALFALIGHIYGASEDSALLLLRPMAINTAFALLSISIGLLAALPDYGLAALLRSSTTAGTLARRLLPVVLLAPILLGWLRLRGEQAHWFGTQGGTALLVSAIVLVLAAFAWRSFALLSRSEAERERVEEALRESEQRHRLLFDVNPEPAWVFDLETLRFLAVNAAAVRKYGYTPSEFQDMTIRDIRPPEDVPRLMKAVSQIGSGSPGGGTWRHRTKDGAMLEVEVVSHTLTFMGRRAQLVMAHDITERRRAEAALTASEERFRALAVSANDAIVSADHHGQITYFNPAAERIFGHTASEVTGTSITVLMPERFREPHRIGFARFLATREPHVVGRTVELVGMRKDGSEFPVELSLATWERDAELGFTAILRDVTARREADDALKRYAAQLEVANSELDAFSYSVSHDLRAPLRSIDGFSAALLEDCADRLGETARDHLGRVRRASQRMAGLIDDLLALSRVTRATLTRERVDLSTLARQICSELRQRDPTRDAEFLIPTDIVSEGDPHLLRIALENLLGNAWKYTARTPQAVIQFGAAENNGSHSYFVRDNGAGFDMRYAEKLFGAFQRLHSAGEFEGTGIGLATVQRIIHRHGGRVWAEGAVGHGATFYFTL
jgi:PAS domain S-box-containing protein